jgi:hypothetical protein
MIRASHIIESISTLNLNERNVGNVDEIDQFVVNLATQADYPEAEKWFKTTLRTYLINDYPDAKIVHKKSELRGRYRSWMEKPLRTGEGIYIVSWPREFEGQLRHVMDYFNYLLGDNEVPRELYVRDLTRLSVEDALEKSEDWTKWLNKGKNISDDTGIEKIMSTGPYTWVRVISKEALDYEGQAMGHCVGSYASRVAQDQCQIYSLRDSKNEPHVTIEARGDMVFQIKGKQNTAVVEKYRDSVAEFLTRSGLDATRTTDIKNIGMYVSDGKVLRDPEPDGYYEVVKHYSDGHSWIKPISPRALQKFFYASKYFSTNTDHYVLLDGNLPLVQFEVVNDMITSADLSVSRHMYSKVKELQGTEKEKTLDIISDMKFIPANRKIAKFVGGIFYRGDFYTDEKDLPTEYWEKEGWQDLFYVKGHDWEGAELPDANEVGRLLDLGVDPDTPVLDGKMTALMFTFLVSDYGDSDASHKEGREILDLLLDAGADINATDEDGATVLHYAASGCNELIGDDIDFFIGKGAKTEVKDYRGNTPLDWAISSEREWNCVALIRHGATASEEQKKNIVDQARGNYEEDLVFSIARDIGYDDYEPEEDD